MSAFDSALLLGDILGFAALSLIGVSTLMAFFRSKLLKMIGSLNLLRMLHMVVSTLAGVLLVLHLAYFIDFPLTSGVVLGYIAMGLAVVVWLTGTAFIERLRDSLRFHSSLSLALIILILSHTASASLDIPIFLSEITLAVVVVLAFANAAHQIRR
jgi:hypothetical protein